MSLASIKYSDVHISNYEKRWPSGNSRGWEAAGGGSSPRPAPGCRDCVCAGVCACVWVCVSLGMARSETTRAASSALSPVSVGVQKSYMTPQCSWVLSKKKVFSCKKNTGVPKFKYKKIFKYKSAWWFSKA